MQMIKRHTDRIEINIFALARLLWKKILLLLLCGLLCAAAAFFCVKVFVTPQYTASAMLYVNNTRYTDAVTSISESDLTASAQLVETCTVIITSDAVLTPAIQRLDGNWTTEMLTEKLSVEAVNGTEVFQISVEDESPEQAAQIAQTLTEVASGKIAEIVEGSSVRVIVGASVPTEPSSPDYVKYTAVGFLLGFLLGIIMIVLREILDDRIKQKADLEEKEYPVLGTIPEFSAAERLR
ncbi:MAG: Wzz/FepE/Etk N-terminal domain-containing protein [Eubacteriales bacterium]|nr:Wzz/FepE/Etk N-terminal domain-containing protein [Eubacteriales bacterium]